MAVPGLPSLDLLRGFVAVGRRMSITLAARDLFLTQSAVSRQIHALEAQLGVPLFTRGHRSIAFTPEGERLFRSADAAIRQLHDAVGELATQRRGALIAIEGRTPLKEYADKGTPIGAPVTSALLQTIFASKGPLHDGAVIVREDTIANAETGHRSITPGHLAYLSHAIGGPVRWDPAAEQVVGNDEAQKQLMSLPYRGEWTLGG